MAESMKFIGKNWVLKPLFFNAREKFEYFSQSTDSSESIVTFGMKNRHSFCYFPLSLLLFSVHD